MNPPTFIRTETPRTLEMGLHDTRHCQLGLPTCKPSISFARPGRLSQYELTGGERVLVCRRACADQLEDATWEDD